MERDQFKYYDRDLKFRNLEDFGSAIFNIEQFHSKLNKNLALEMTIFVQIIMPFLISLSSQIINLI